MQTPKLNDLIFHQHINTEWAGALSDAVITKYNNTRCK